MKSKTLSWEKETHGKRRMRRDEIVSQTGDLIFEDLGHFQLVQEKMNFEYRLFELDPSLKMSKHQLL
jgi:hypothetical protein